MLFVICNRRKIKLLVSCILIHCAPYNNFKLRLNIMYKYVIITLLNDVITFLTSLKCNYNVTQVIHTVFFQFQFQIPIIRHKSFVSPAPRGRGIAGLLTFSFLKPHRRAKLVVNFLLNARPRGLTIMTFVSTMMYCYKEISPSDPKIDRAFLHVLTNYSGPRVGCHCLTTIHMKDTFNPGSL